jgi:hypothetical protein
MITKPEVELRRLSFITVGEVPLWWGRGPSLLHRRLRSGAADYADTDSHHSDGGYNSNHPSRDPAGHDRLHPRMRFTPDYDCASPMLVIWSHVMSELLKSVLDLKPIVAEPHSTWGTTITLSQTRFVAADMGDAWHNQSHHQTNSRSANNHRSGLVDRGAAAAGRHYPKNNINLELTAVTSGHSTSRAIGI